MVVVFLIDLGVVRIGHADHLLGVGPFVHVDQIDFLRDCQSTYRQARSVHLLGSVVAKILPNACVVRLIEILGTLLAPSFCTRFAVAIL